MTLIILLLFVFVFFHFCCFNRLGLTTCWLDRRGGWMAETDPKVMVCDWKCVSRGLTTTKTLRKHIYLFRQGYALHRCQSGCALFEAGLETDLINLMFQCPCKILAIWLTRFVNELRKIHRGGQQSSNEAVTRLVLHAHICSHPPSSVWFETQ